MQLMKITPTHLAFDMALFVLFLTHDRFPSIIETTCPGSFNNGGLNLFPCHYYITMTILREQVGTRLHDTLRKYR